MRAVVIGGWLLFAAAASVAPEALRSWCTKEGLVEELSHGLLIVAILLWIAGVIRGPRRGSMAAGALFVAVLLGEEVDWGAVWGLKGGLRAISGEVNLHNAWAGTSYLLFGLPLLWLYGPALFAGAEGGSASTRFGGRGPSTDEAQAFVLVALGATLAPFVGQTWEPELDEFAELLLYVVLLSTAARIAGLTDVRPEPTPSP